MSVALANNNYNSNNPFSKESSLKKQINNHSSTKPKTAAKVIESSRLRQSTGKKRAMKEAYKSQGGSPLLESPFPLKRGKAFDEDFRSYMALH